MRSSAATRWLASASVMLGLSATASAVEPEMTEAGVATVATCEYATVPEFWASAEYLNWRLRNAPLSFPLIAIGNPLDNILGALTQPGTRVRIGEETD